LRFVTAPAVARFAVMRVRRGGLTACAEGSPTDFLTCRYPLPSMIAGSAADRVASPEPIRQGRDGAACARPRRPPRAGRTYFTPVGESHFPVV